MSKINKCLIFVSVLFLGLNLNPAYAGNEDPVFPARKVDSYLVMQDLLGMKPHIAVRGTLAATDSARSKDPFETIPVLNRIRHTFTRDLNKFGPLLTDLGLDKIKGFPDNKRPR